VCVQQCCTCISLLLLCVSSSAIHVLVLSFLITLQQTVDTVTVEGDENIEEEECNKIKTEEDYIQLVRTVKTEQEVSVLCWCILW